MVGLTLLGNRSFHWRLLLSLPDIKGASTLALLLARLEFPVWVQPLMFGGFGGRQLDPWLLVVVRQVLPLGAEDLG